MAAGADSIDDMDLLRHGAMSTLFGGVRAPSTLGSHLRCYTWGNVGQLEKAGRQFLAALSRQAPLLPGAGTLAFIDIDSMQNASTAITSRARVRAHEDPGEIAAGAGPERAGRGRQHAALRAGDRRHRLRGGNAASARGAASLAAHAIGTVRVCGCTGEILVRLDSAFYNATVIGAIRRGGTRFSVTVPLNASVRAAIAAVARGRLDRHPVPARYLGRPAGYWVSDAEVAEIPYTAFTSKKGPAVTARLIVRRVRDRTGTAAPGRASCSPTGVTTPSSPAPVRAGYLKP